MHTHTQLDTKWWRNLFLHNHRQGRKKNLCSRTWIINPSTGTHHWCLTIHQEFKYFFAQPKSFLLLQTSEFDDTKQTVTFRTLAILIYIEKKEEFVPFYGYIQSSWKGKKCHVTNSDENEEGVFASKCSDSIGRCFGFCCRQAVCGDSSMISIACSSIVYNLCNWLVRGKALPRVEGTHTNTKLAYKGDQSDGTMSTLNLEWLCHFFFSSSSLKTY